MNHQMSVPVLASHSETTSLIDKNKILDSIIESERDSTCCNIYKMIGCFFGYLCIPFSCACDSVGSSFCYPYVVVPKDTNCVIIEDNKVIKKIGTGTHYVNPLTQKVQALNIIKISIELADAPFQNANHFEPLILKSYLEVRILNLDGKNISPKNIDSYSISRTIVQLLNRDIVESVQKMSRDTIIECINGTEPINIEPQVRTFRDSVSRQWEIATFSLKLMQ